MPSPHGLECGRKNLSLEPFQRLEARLKTGGLVILEGANGSELERLGARMDHDVWCVRTLAEIRRL